MTKISLTHSGKRKDKYSFSFARFLSCLVAALLAICLSAKADTTLFTSAFSGNSGAAVLSGNADNTSGTASLTINDWTNNAAVTSISGLTAISTTSGGFTVLQNGTATYANTNCVFINRNLNLDGSTCQRGYSFTFTVNTNFDLTTLTVTARHTSNTGNLAQQYTSDLHYSISGGTLGAPLSGYATETYPLSPTTYTVVPFSLGNATIGAGTYTVQVYMSNLTSGGAYATYQGITLAGNPSATTYYLKAGEPSGSSSFTTPLTGSASGWTNAGNSTVTAPAAGNDYHVNVANLRSPNAAGTYVFQGNRLYVDTGGRFLGKPGSGGVTCSANYVLNGGYCDPANATTDNNILTLAGTVTVNAASVLGALGGTSSGSSAETLDLTAPISGSAALQVSGSAINSGADTGVVRLSAANPYSGTITVTNANGGVVASAVSRILLLNNLNALSNATLNLTASVANPVSFSNVVNTGTFNVGALSGSSSQALLDTAGSPVALSVGGNNASTTYSGVLSGTNGALIKTGSGTLTLTGTNTYTGNTTVNGGTLGLAAASFATSSTVSVTNGAHLQLNFGVTNQITALVLNGVSQSQGLYSSANASPYLTGSGYLLVSPASQTLTPTFSPAAGSYAAGQAVTISSATAGSTIYYTTNGSMPTMSSPNGPTPVTVLLPANTNMTIQAFALASGYTASIVASATYSTYTNYTWINTAGGNWSVGANWSNNAVANGVGTPADFSELTLSGGVTVTLNTPITVGSMAFGDQANANSWTVANGGAGPLTLNNGTNTSAITVNNQTTTISALLAGTNGLIKTGSGLLLLTNAETYSGGTTVNGGTLALDYNVGDAATGTLNGGNPVTVNANGTLRLDIEDALGYNGGIPSALNINGGLVTSADVANTTSVQNGGTSFRVSIPPLNFNGGTLSSGANNQGDNYGGSYLLGTVNTYSNTTTAVMNAYSVSLQGNGMITVAAGNTPSGVDFDVSSQLRGWVGGNSALTKAGAGFMELDQNGSPYNNAVNVNGGTLFLNGTLGNGTVTVASNARFLAAGSLNGPIVVSTGGTFGVGYTNINTLISYSSVTFNSGSTNYMKISKNGGSAQSDQVQQLTSVVFAGTLVVSNITSDATPLASGDTFSFFPSSLAYSGHFSSVVLPALPVGLGWDVSQLTVNGTIQVSSSAAPPTFNPPSGGYGGSLSVTISSLTPGATIYYTTDGSTPTTSSPNGITPVTVLLPANTNLTIQAFASESGYFASSVQSASYTTYSNYIWVNPSGGNWSGTANWSNNAVANGVGAPADFSELALSGSASVTLDIPATVGSLIFGDQANANGWTLADGGAGPLTLNNGTNTSSINVLNQSVNIQAQLAGSTSMIKTGVGTLILSGQNNYSGSTVVSAGTLQLNSPGTGAPNTLEGNSPVVVNTGATLLASANDALGFQNYTASNGIVLEPGSLLTVSPTVGMTVGRSLTSTGATISSQGTGRSDIGFSLFMSSVNGAVFTLSSSSNGTPSVLNATNISLDNTVTFNVTKGGGPVDWLVTGNLQTPWFYGNGGGVVLNGNGVTVFSNAMSYTYGGTTVNGGVLALDYNPGDQQTGTLAGNTTINVNSAGELRLDVEDALGYSYGLPAQLNINGGLVTSADVANGGSSFRVTLPTLTMTGGTLSSGTNMVGDAFGGSYLLQPAVTTLASSNTAVINAYSVSLQNATFTVASGTTPSGVDLDVSSILSNWLGNPQSLTKAGPGVMTLDGVNTYSGPTTVSAGTLALRGNGSIAGSPSIVIAGGANLDVSGLNSAFVLGGTQTLGNSGSTGLVKGNAGTAAGTLSLQYSNGIPSLEVTGGTLTLTANTRFAITNTGSQLPVGVYPVIVSAGGGSVAGAVANGTVTVAGGGAAATATLAIANGELQLVVNPVNPNPTNIVATVSGHTLNLSWPADHLGWILQTNSVGLAATNQWFAYPGSASVTNVSISIDASQTNVFFRMVYP